MKTYFSRSATLAALVVTAWNVGAVAAAESVGPHNREEAQKIMAEMRRIVSPKGVERLEKVRIGGIDQWLSIRGVDKRNPVLLYLHGGPGFSVMASSWYFSRGWEEYFTVVHWDQRGAGKTYVTNDPEKIRPTMTKERMVKDTEEVITWLRREFGKERIFVLGHSWGSYLGIEMAQRHPDWLHAYIGMGQVTNAPESERRGWRYAMEHAQRAKDQAAIRDLQSIAPYAADGKPVTIKEIMIQRKYLNIYGGYVYHRVNSDHEGEAAKLAPEYTDDDVKNLWTADDFAEGILLPEVLKLDFTPLKTLKCPTILFVGRYDYDVSASAAAEWFEHLQAPSKKIVWFERSGHMMHTEEPGKVLISLVEFARPFAERAGDIEPTK